MESRLTKFPILFANGQIQKKVPNIRSFKASLKILSFCNLEGNALLFANDRLHYVRSVQLGPGWSF